MLIFREVPLRSGKRRRAGVTFPLLVLVLLGGTGAMEVDAQTSAQAIVQRFYQVSGGVAWERFLECDSVGTITLQGKTGSLRYVEDLRSGANRSAIEIPALEVKQGSGNSAEQAGQPSWEQDAAGDIELATQDNPASIDDRYLTSRSYWRDGLGGAAAVLLAPKKEGAETLDGVRLSVPKGKGFTLWFDRGSGLLASIEGSTAKRFSDYRSVDGVLLPFVEAKPQGDGELVVRYTSRILRERLDPSAFAIPFHTDYQMPASGMVRVPAEHGLEFQATINGQGPFRGVFDTGAVNFMSENFARQLGLTLETESITFGTSSPASTQVHKAHVKRLQIGDLLVRDQTFYVAAMPADPGTPSFLLGYELLRRFAVKIDFVGQILTFYDGAHFHYSGPGAAVPLHYRGNGLIVEASVGGASGAFLLDSGNEFGFSLSTGFVKRNDLLQRLGAQYRGYNGRGLAGPSPEAYLARVTTLRIGPVQVPSVVAHLTTDAADTSELAGNIGQSILNKFTEVFDCMLAQVFFETTARSNEAEVFNEAGLIFDTFGSGLQVMTVLPGGPGAAAGLQTGDVLVLVDGKQPGDEVNAPAFLQAPGTTVHLTVHRGTESRKVDVVLAHTL